MRGRLWHLDLEVKKFWQEASVHGLNDAERDELTRIIKNLNQTWEIARGVDSEKE